MAAFDASVRDLERITLLFENLTASETSPALQAVELSLAPRLASHHASILTDAATVQPS